MDIRRNQDQAVSLAPSGIAVESGDWTRVDLHVLGVNLTAKKLALVLESPRIDIDMPGFGTTVATVVPAVATPFEDCTLLVRRPSCSHAPSQLLCRPEQHFESGPSAVRQGATKNFNAGAAVFLCAVPIEEESVAGRQKGEPCPIESFA